MTPDACDLKPRYFLSLLECVCQVNLAAGEIRYISGVTLTILTRSPTHQVRISAYIGLEWSNDTSCMWPSAQILIKPFGVCLSSWFGCRRDTVRKRSHIDHSVKSVICMGRGWLRLPFENKFQGLDLGMVYRSKPVPSYYFTLRHLVFY